jgi:uncharacterized protein YndB with AHSA1/START domain
MSIDPIVRTVQVKLPPARAFDAFTTRMGSWWPRGKTIGRNPHAEIVITPKAGGRWFERDGAGNETDWGHVLAWEPPGRLLLAWQLDCEFGFNPDILTEVEIIFAPADGGGTLVRLEHRNLERFGADAPRVAEKIGNGWPARLAEFAAWADNMAGMAA